MLGVGLLFLILALIFDILFIDTGVLNFIYLGDYGFIPLLVIMSLQLSNQVIRMDEELRSYRQNLEQMVSQRTKELEEITFALRRSERQIRALLDAPPDTEMLVTPNGDILATNQIGAMRMGLSAEEAVGKNVFDIFGPEITAERKRKKDILLQRKQPIQWEDQRAGRIYQNSMYPILDDENEIESVAIFAADITEQKQLRAKEKESAAMEERNRLARDLHDAVTQTIYSASLIAEALPQVWERNPEEGRRNLTKLRALVRGAQAEMRSLLFELRPDSLEKASMDTLIQFVADAFTGRTRVPVTLEVTGFGELPANVKIAIYRISQEVFNNISKYAEATSVEVNLKMGNNAVALSIMDNGIGFDTQQNQKPGMGLLIMGERAAEIGAQLDIESWGGHGTQIDLSWAATNEEKFDE